MLVGEIHGKGMPEATNHEDYLTSVIFDHLRYVPPSHFWEDLFSQAKGCQTRTIPRNLSVKSLRRMEFRFQVTPCCKLISGRTTPLTENLTCCSISQLDLCPFLKGCKGENLERSGFFDF